MSAIVISSSTRIFAQLAIAYKSPSVFVSSRSPSTNCWQRLLCVSGVDKPGCNTAQDDPRAIGPTSQNGCLAYRFAHGELQDGQDSELCNTSEIGMNRTFNRYLSGSQELALGRYYSCSRSQASDAMVKSARIGHMVGTL